MKLIQKLILKSSRFLVLPLALSSALAFAERPCPEYYVDIADEDEGLYDHCDFKQSGLNGWIHSKVDQAQGSASASESDIPEKTEAVAQTDNAPIKKQSANQQAVKSGAFQTMLTEPAANAVQLQEQRFATLQKLAKACANGYKIESESYQAVANSDQLQLAIEYQCL